MMDTILNLGLNDQAVEALAKRSNNPRFAFDSYRRLIQMFGDVVLDIPKKKFEHIFDGVKAAKKVKFDYELQPDALKKIIEEYKNSLCTRSTTSLQNSFGIASSNCSLVIAKFARDGIEPPVPARGTRDVGNVSCSTPWRHQSE